MNNLYYIIAGLVSGVVGGMGMGGGTLLIPILTIFLTIAQKNAQAINLLVFIPMSLFALFVHIKNKLVDFKVGIPIIVIGIVFSLGGSFIANTLTNGFLKRLFGIFLLGVGINQMYQTIKNCKKTKEKEERVYKFKIMIK